VSPIINYKDFICFNISLKGGFFKMNRDFYSIKIKKQLKIGAPGAILVIYRNSAGAVL